MPKYPACDKVSNYGIVQYAQPLPIDWNITITTAIQELIKRIERIENLYLPTEEK